MTHKASEPFVRNDRCPNGRISRGEFLEFIDSFEERTTIKAAYKVGQGKALGHLTFVHFCVCLK